MKKVLIILATILVLAGGGYAVYAALKEEDNQPPAAVNTQETQTPANEEATPPTEEPVSVNFDFAQPKKSAHYVSNIPGHGAILDSAPTQVSLIFNFDLSTASTISVMKNGQEVSTGAAAISADKLTLSKALIVNAGSGLYTVNYNACWPDGSCHDGQFQFGVK